MANNTFTLPAITVDTGFVEIREVDGELLALFNRGQETSSWYSVEKMIGVHFITMGNGSHFNLYNNFINYGCTRQTFYTVSDSCCGTWGSHQTSCNETMHDGYDVS